MLNVLLAEDNVPDVVLVEQALEQHRVECELNVVRDGAAALEYIAIIGAPGQAPCPDVFLLDLNLPKLDGVQVLTEFRKHPLCARVPIIIVTSSDARRDHERVQPFGIARYFRKPSDYDAFMQLGAVIREVVGTEKS